MLCVDVIAATDVIGEQSRGQMQPIENMLLGKQLDDEISASAEFSGIEKKRNLLLRNIIVVS
jgi:hypothetical protein